jgi:hypothetical protein
MNRAGIADLIAPRLMAEAGRMTEEFHTPGRVASTFIDDLLPEALARKTTR